MDAPVTDPERKHHVLSLFNQLCHTRIAIHHKDILFGIEHDLVTEFQRSVSDESKEQIVANLGNFAYDPLNYEYFRKLNVLELFLDCITEPNEKLVEFAVAGICNCSPDPANAAALVASGAIPLVISCLSSPVENTVLSSMTTLYYLCTNSTRKDIIIPSVVESLRAYASPNTVNPRFRSVAKAFLDKHVDR